MSTFNGLVAEFPDIRVDFFRTHPGRRPPLACFLSHIHSDHLAGLESIRSPFVYCSAATREMLIRLERYPCRINYAHGILETRVQRYRHLKKLLKPLPLDTPTILELEPGNCLQITLFNANHCPGAVMFLFEGQGKAVLYTGDIRSEPWFVDAIARSPSLIEYSSGLKTLDTIYLDTSNIENIDFPTKSEGISELLRKVSKYPANTVFHFQAWTFGYEDVWIALSKALGSKIHVDEYKMAIFRSLLVEHPDKTSAPLHRSPEAPGLVGFMCGNTHHDGCLTLDETVRIHSCEKGNYCQTVKKSPVVWIRPIITRLPDGQDVADVGVGGGGEDLEREVELDYLSPIDIETFLELLCDTGGGAANDLREKVHLFLLDAVANGRKVPLNLARSIFRENVAELVNALQAITKKIRLREQGPANSDHQPLPNVVTFPYSRHSSYPELCALVNAFKPRDVWPCTVDVPRWLREGITIGRLFSQQCSRNQFRHDDLMRKRFTDFDPNLIANISSQLTAVTSTDSFPCPSPAADGAASPQLSQDLGIASTNLQIQSGPSPYLAGSAIQSQNSDDPEPIAESADLELDPTSLHDSQDSNISALALDTRLRAFRAALENSRGAAWEIGLLSTTDNHSKLDEDLTYAEHLS